MPIDLEIIRASEFVRIGPRGQTDFKSSQHALELMAAACQKRGIDRALLDLRELPVPERPLFTPSQLAELVETFHKVGFGYNQRLAVLYRSDPHHGARMFAFISAMRGWQVCAFSQFESALLWLSEENAGKQERGTEVPVRKGGRKAKTSTIEIPVKRVSKP